MLPFLSLVQGGLVQAWGLYSRVVRGVSPALPQALRLSCGFAVPVSVTGGPGGVWRVPGSLGVQREEALGAEKRSRPVACLVVAERSRGPCSDPVCSFHRCLLRGYGVVTPSWRRHRGQDRCGPHPDTDKASLSQGVGRDGARGPEPVGKPPVRGRAARAGLGAPRLTPQGCAGRELERHR